MNIGLGCMRLSTLREREDERSVEVIRAALDAGATLLDTADAYCLDDSETGHNERLVARALEGWPGDRSKITVATKGGMRRPKGAWVPDGRAKHLREACDASRRALGVETIDLYQLHVVDPKTPIETSVRALAKLRDDGLIRDIGLGNVTVHQIEAARAIAPIASVQVSLSPFDDENLRNGVAEHCRDSGIRLIAYRPLGGEKRKKLKESPEVILGWLMSLGVTPIPGATRVETAMGIGRALTAKLDERTLSDLDERYSGRLLRVPRPERRPKTPRGEVVLIMGMPGSGKTFEARRLERSGFERLNRDDLGGSLHDLVPRLDALLGSGTDRVVLDNTYPTRASRNKVIETAWRHGASVRCLWFNTPLVRAQVNAIMRMIEAHGSLPTPDVIKAKSKTDARFLLPDAQFRFERTLEPPTVDEGFTSVDVSESFPVLAGTRKALILNFDDRASISRAALDRHRAEGWLVFVHAWRPDAAELAKTEEVLGPAEISVCPHEAGPPVCWCRKPIPGSLIEFVMRRAVDLGESIVVATSAADRAMADRLALRFVPELR